MPGGGGPSVGRRRRLAPAVQIELRPRRRGEAAARRVRRDLPRRVVAEPDAGDERRRVADEPDVVAVVRRARLAGDRPRDAHVADRACPCRSPRRPAASDVSSIRVARIHRRVARARSPRSRAACRRPPRCGVTSRGVHAQCRRWRTAHTPPPARAASRPSAPSAMDGTGVQRTRDAVAARRRDHARSPTARLTRTVAAFAETDQRPREGDAAGVLVVVVRRAARLSRPMRDFDRLVVDERRPASYPRASAAA